MASCQSARWVSTSPYIKLTVTQSESTDTDVTLSWTLQYISDSEARTSSSRPYTVTIAGTEVKSGSFDINLLIGTHTIASGTKKINKTTSAQTISFGFTFDFSITWSGNWKGVVSASNTISVAKKTSYTVSYNANGGSGAPASQTKWHGTTLTLSNTKPTRPGHTFKGWALSKADADSGKWYYQAGGSCGKNENLTLYATWEPYTYSVNFNANGGTGAPGEQEKTYGVTLKLSTTVPTRTNYNFLGWATSASSTTVSYKAGSNYTANNAITLYAVWELAYVKPRITDIAIYRCIDLYTESDNGTFVFVSFGWECDQTTTKVLIEFESLDGTTVYTASPDLLSGTSGSFEKFISDYEFSTDSTYICRITVEDESGSNGAVRTINGAKYIIDILAEGEGIAFNKPAELVGVMDIAFQTRLAGGLLYMVLEPETDLNEVRIPGFYVGANVSTYNYGHCPLTSGTFTLEVKSAGPSGQLLQCMTLCDKKKSQAYERFYYGGDWPIDSNGNYIWTGEWINAIVTGPFGDYYQDRYAPQYRKDGRMVEVRGIISPTEDLEYSTTHTTIFTLPDGYRPDMPLYIPCQGSGNCMWLLRINTDGAVGFARYRDGDTNTTATPGAWLPFQATFLTN